MDFVDFFVFDFVLVLLCNRLFLRFFVLDYVFVSDFAVHVGDSVENVGLLRGFKPVVVPQNEHQFHRDIYVADEFDLAGNFNFFREGFRVDKHVHNKVILRVLVDGALILQLEPFGNADFLVCLLFLDFFFD